MNTSLKWLALASLTHLVGNILGTVIVPPRNLAAKFGGLIDGQVSLGDFLSTFGTVMSVPIAVWLIQLGLTLLALRPGWSGRIGVGGLIFVGAFYTITGLGTGIVLLLSAGGVDRQQTIAFWMNVPLTIAMMVLGINAWKTIRVASTASN